jgi:hypothetical protein
MSDVYGAALAKRIIAAYGEEIDLWSVRSADLHPLDLAMVKWIILKHWRTGALALGCRTTRRFRSSPASRSAQISGSPRT